MAGYCCAIEQSGATARPSLWFRTTASHRSSDRLWCCSDHLLSKARVDRDSQRASLSIGFCEASRQIPVLYWFQDACGGASHTATSNHTRLSQTAQTCPERQGRFWNLHTQHASSLG